MLIITSCTETTVYAPVVNGNIDPIPQSGQHVVRKQETLYSIAWRYGLDYRAIAQINNIRHPYHITQGDRLYLKKRAPTQTLAQQTVTPLAPSIMDFNFEDRESNDAGMNWVYPANGRVIGKFARFDRGIDISGRRGDPVVAAGPGQVVYAGNGLRSYGNLIIIKHNGSFLTAYAHNDKILVREGAQIAAGQQIAEMGSTGTDQVKLHFEIRYDGKPVNPLVYLRKQRYTKSYS